MKRLIAAVLTVGVVTLGTAGIAAAQQTGGSGPSTSQPASNTAGANKKGHPRVERAALRIVASTLGVKPKDVVSGLCGGQTLAQLASAHGKSASDLITALDNAAKVRITKAEQNGRINSTQAAQRESTVDARVTKLVNSFQPSTQRCQMLKNRASASPTTGT